MPEPATPEVPGLADKPTLWLRALREGGALVILGGALWRMFDFFEQACVGAP